MVQFEYFPSVIDAHRDDLRAIYQPRSPELGAPPWRRALGVRLVQLGRWLQGTRPALAGEPRATLGESTGSA